MRKYFLENRDLTDPSGWDEHWNISKDEIITSWRNSASLISLPVLVKHFQNADRVLEGGCGKGEFVFQLKKRGINVIGVDFAENTIKAIKQVDPDFPIQRGDLLNLEFEDTYFDGVYLGGVIEHFENGPFEILSEVSRVLRPGGKLILTVPSLNYYRWWQDFLSTSKSKYAPHPSGSWQYVKQKRFEEEISIPGWHFAEYRFTKSELDKIFKEFNFQTVEYKMVGIASGLKDIPFIHKKIASNKGSTAIPTNGNTVPKRRQLNIYLESNIVTSYVLGRLFGGLHQYVLSK